MSNHSLENVQKFFAQALALSPDDRAVFLNRTCGESPALRLELDELLHYDDLAEGESFMNKPQKPQAEPDGLSGSRLGPYLIRDLVGHGGMGSVYRAVRVEDFHQEVAIKVAQQDGVEVLRRFQSERQLLAGLNHTNIARLYDGGVMPDGKPYFVMELVRGQRIDRWCEGHPASFKQLVELLLQACEGISHAHLHGIIHRDLKPANILVTDQGQVRVVDFGLARSLSSTHSEALTATGALLGTPSFMAPEQAEGEKGAVGPATDVYGLGAVLYQLLTSRPPFTANSPWQTMHLVQNEDPVPPSKLTPDLPRDLETICLKCLEKRPEKRYPTADGLAKDLGRFLRGEPVLARRLSKTARAARWCWRHPLTAGLSATIVLLAVGSFLGMATLWRNAAAGWNIADRRLDLFSDTIEPSVAMFENRLRLPQPLSPDERKDLINVLGVYDKWVAAAGDDEASCARAGAVCYRIGEIFLLLEAIPETADAYQRAISIYSKLKAMAPGNPKYQYWLARSYRIYGTAVGMLDRHDEREAAYRRGVEELEDLRRRYPDVKAYSRALAEHQGDLGRFLILDGRKAEGERVVRAAQATINELVQQNPSDANLHIQRLGFAQMIADLALEQGEIQPKLAVFNECMDYAELFRKQHHENPGLIRYTCVYAACAETLCNLGRADEAEAVLQRGRRVLEEVSVQGEASPWYRAQLINVALALGHIMWNRDQKLAEEEFLRARKSIEAFVKDYPDSFEHRYIYAYLLALLPTRQSIDLEFASRLADIPPNSRSKSTDPELARASVLFGRKEFNAAKPLLEELLAGPIARDRTLLLGMLATCHWQLGQCERAKELLSATSQCVKDLHTSYTARLLYREASEMIGPPMPAKVKPENSRLPRGG